MGQNGRSSVPKNVGSTHSSQSSPKMLKRRVAPASLRFSLLVSPVNQFLKTNHVSCLLSNPVLASNLKSEDLIILTVCNLNVVTKLRLSNSLDTARRSLIILKA